MTQAARTRQGTRRRGVVYGIDVLDHAAWMRGELVVMPNDYIGQTRQPGRGRENQHRDDKPWSDLIVGSPRILWEGLCTDAELDDIERRLIQQGVGGVRPRLNWMLNESNRLQIPIPRQEEQRWLRDDRRGEARWVPAKERGSVAVTAASVVSGPGWWEVRFWAPWQQKTGLWSISWLTASLVVWGGFVRLGWFSPWGWRGQALSAGLLVTAVLIRALTWGRKRRRRRR